MKYDGFTTLPWASIPPVLKEYRFDEHICVLPAGVTVSGRASRNTPRFMVSKSSTVYDYVGVKSLGVRKDQTVREVYYTLVGLCRKSQTYLSANHLKIAHTKSRASSIAAMLSVDLGLNIPDSAILVYLGRKAGWLTVRYAPPVRLLPYLSPLQRLAYTFKLGADVGPLAQAAVDKFVAVQNAACEALLKDFKRRQADVERYRFFGMIQ